MSLVPFELSGDGREVRVYLLALACLFMGTLLCIAALRVAVLDVPAAALASGGAAAWLLANGPGAGRVLLEPLPGNGVTSADLLALPAAGLVVALVRRRLHDR